LLKKRKIKLLAILNLLNFYFNFLFKLKKSPQSPLLLNVELWNECNEACLFCRSNDGVIHSPDENIKNIPKGKADLNLVLKSIKDFHKRLLLFIPYINGEPLISPILPNVLSYCKSMKVGTLVASNGISLDLNKSLMLIENDLDFLKVHISGMTNEVHRIQHRSGDINKILRNIKNFQKLNKKKSTLVMLDYISYNHNNHQIDEAKNFCIENDLIFNLRPGNNKFLEATESTNIPNINVSKKPCDWIWGTLSIDWNGAVLPCCDHVLWPGQNEYGNLNKTSAYDIWHGKKIIDFRESIINCGRDANMVCKDCKKEGIYFKS
jgi:MoaA/NifB/PqqE/SkfB family radical SAM enzyme